MSLFELPCLLSSLLLGQTGPEPPAPDRPADGASFIPGTGTTARRDNEAALNLARLGVSVDPAPVGLRVRVGLGTSVEVPHAAEPEATAIGPQGHRVLPGVSRWISSSCS